ncbi:aspartyl-tRNA(Asn)/glutamyl-tRNA(Gln) amidotransferase subunit C [Catalinimonas alkaloidigena]|uniref:Asp-tRNA(Asn)/Glu-tRNA(Gln) amidotransferase subunit GatC n=1 Tax=Catalinimonas alkaloidigena TaxID=1075417 RepID=UPI00240562A0|nr:Asp-tRNA(Asn)/Glu-tRNA(Gln) amidotransferase subunit GatC [Catalinimonas alkaloidigena]MDF9797332.1 aspartyl-tRNA(Asn)/glutamyl-tRNA(Gln) amidotransferase subunit C [Catalinimonas alkaloidigena]
MKIDRSTIQKIAHLARLEFEHDAEEEMIKSMSEILDWVDQLKEVDTDGVEPLTSMSHEVNVWREDKVKDTLSHDRGLSQAPRRDEDYIRVPKVIE